MHTEDAVKTDKADIVNGTNEASNEAALQAFADKAGDQAPRVVVSPNQATKLEWQGQLSFDHYRSTVITPTSAGAATLPTLGGIYQRWTFQSELKIIDAGGTNFLQTALTGSNDRAVLSRYTKQLSQIQFGRQTTNYAVSAGDVMVNYSSLGTTLGMRGLMLSNTFGPVTLQLQSGVVAESWESLGKRQTVDGSPIRNQLERDVNGAKIEYAWSQALKTYLTLQRFADRADTPSLRVSSSQASQADFTLPPLLASSARSGTAGFTWQPAKASLTGEWAEASHERGSDKNKHSRRRASAMLLDATWRLGETNNAVLRAGYHQVDPNYVSLSQTIPAGVDEYYVGVDAPLATWLQAGLDWRDSSMRYALPFDNTDTSIDEATRQFLAPVAAPNATHARGVNARLQINFGANWPGWNITAQQASNHNIDGQGNQGQNRQQTIGLSFVALGWNGNLNLLNSTQQNQASPLYDSVTRGWQWQISRALMSDPLSATTWSLNLGANLSSQNQQITALGQQTKNSQVGLNLSGQHLHWGQANVQWTNAFMTQPQGGPALKSQSLQLDVSMPFLKRHSIKSYWRESRRNVGAPLLATKERHAGLQFVTSW
jgi:hypothetical protein